MYCCHCGARISQDACLCHKCGKSVASSALPGRALGRRGAARTESVSAKTAERVRRLLEGREAIYVEKGAAHVRVSNVRWDAVLKGIVAEVEEIPTAGFPCLHYPGSSPRRWTIGVGDKTTLSEEKWGSGYGGWSLYFASDIVNGVLNLVSQLPPDLAFIPDRYNKILDYLQG